jgi:hypothetical protein
MESLVVSFVRWHSHQEDGDFVPPLADDFEFDDGLESVSRDDFLVLQRGRGKIERLAVIDLIVSGDRAAVMFEGVDSVTGLFHRSCWMFSVAGDRIRRVSSCVAHLLSPDERPVWR